MEEIRLKVLVDKNKNRVIFAESDSDFIDVLFCFLTTPIGSIIRLSAEQSLNVGIGCMNHLYKSVENINVQSFLTAHSKDMLLYPRNGAEAYFPNLKLRIDSGMGAKFFVCKHENCQESSDGPRLLSYFRNLPCKCGYCTYAEVDMFRRYNLASKLPFGANDGGVFVKEMNRYMISDDLQVIPLSSASSIRLLSKCGVTDGSSIEERTFTFGVVEVLKVLVYSSVSRTPLTDTLLNHKPTAPGTNDLSTCQRVWVESQVRGPANQSGNMSIKLIVSKSKNMVCYAEAKKDFVDFLFSFLTVPLGHVVKQINHGNLKGCLDQLYKSVQELDEQVFKSNNHKDILLRPKVAPGFSYENDLLGTEEATYPTFYEFKGKLTTDKSHLPCSKPGTRAYKVMEHKKDGEGSGGFLLGPNLFTVTDNLVVTPISPILGLSILNELKVPFSDIEEKVVHIGTEEALRLLVSSFVSESALTDAFIGKPKPEQAHW
ncbi:hypothetical protein TIFTF001_000337 [Ficus carica]|uniref:DUF674 family protein n=1 Tax=Ficus carica TaxID=3494 RepID=A0AA88CNY6_FICCA|nr:hypothetical protein TIFTF001_000337 [Ficus carica]